MKPHPVFDGEHLRATVFRPRRSKLFVSFRQRVGHAGVFDEAQPVMGYLRRGYAHLHLQARNNDWFINAETEALETRLAQFVQRYDEVIAMGFSMGGYGALRFAKVLRITRVMAISPQVSIDPTVVPFDKRYRAEAAGWDDNLGDLTQRRCDLSGVVLVDPFKQRDLVHGRMICEIFPRLTLVRLPNGGHPATRALKEGGRFDWLKADLAEGLADPQAITRAHREVRRKSVSYWTHLAQNARWHGREALAQEADTHVRRLTEAAPQRG